MNKNTTRRIARISPHNPDSSHRVLGIDPSLSSTGFSYRFDGELYTGRIESKKLTGPARLKYIRDRMAEVLDVAQPSYIGYEDYAMSMRAHNAFHLGELGGVLRLLIWERGIDVLLVSPAGLKKAVVGKGNADKGKKDKPEMREAIASKFGYDLRQNDEADAFALMALAEIRFGVGPLPVGVRKQLRLDSVADFKIVRGKGADLRLIAK